jgi:hypothetical protein
MSLKHIDLIYEQRFNSHWSDRLHSKKKNIKDFKRFRLYIYIYIYTQWCVMNLNILRWKPCKILRGIEDLVKWWIATDFQWWNSKRVIWGFRIERKQDWAHQIERMQEGLASDVKRGGYIYIYIWSR